MTEAPGELPDEVSPESTEEVPARRASRRGRHRKPRRRDRGPVEADAAEPPPVEPPSDPHDDGRDATPSAADATPGDAPDEDSVVAPEDPAEEPVEPASGDEQPTVSDAVSAAAVMRRQALRRRRRRAARRLALAVVAAIAVVAASVVGSVLWFTRPASEPPVDSIPVISGDGGSVLVVLTDATGSAVGFALAATHPDYEDRLVLFPSGLLTILPGFGTWELAQSAEFGERDLPAVTLANLLGARIDGTVWVPVTAVAAELDGTRLDLPSPVIVAEGDEQVVAVAEGSAPRDADRIELILGERGSDDELTWLVRQGLVWDALVDRASATAGVVDSLMASSTGDVTVGRDVLVALAGDPDQRVTAAQVRPIASLGGAEERYRLPVNDAEALIEDQAPYLALSDGERPKVELLNGTDRVALTPPIAARLVREGFRVVLTDNADRDDYDVTRIVGHTQENQQTALDVYDVLGFGEVRLEVRQPSGIVDVTVIVGDDFS